MITRPSEYWDLLYRIQDYNNTAATSGQIPPIQLPSGEPTLKIDLNTRKIEAPEILSVMYDHRAEVLFFEVDRYYDGMDLANTCCVIQYLNAKPKNPEGRLYAVPFYDTVSRQYLPIEVTEEEFYKNPFYYWTQNEYVVKYIPCGEFSRYNETIAYYIYDINTDTYIKIDVSRKEFEKDPTTYYTKMAPANFTQCNNDSIYDSSMVYFYQANKMLIPWEVGCGVTEYAGEVQFAVRFYNINPDGDLLTFSLNTMPAKSKVLYGIDYSREEIYDDYATEYEKLLEKVNTLSSEYNLYWLELT